MAIVRVRSSFLECVSLCSIVISGPIGYGISPGVPYPRKC